MINFLPMFTILVFSVALYTALKYANGLSGALDKTFHWIACFVFLAIVLAIVIGLIQFIL